MKLLTSTTPDERLIAAASWLGGAFGAREVSAVVADMSDDALLAFMGVVAEGEKALALLKATGAAEVTRRSARELGYNGLAQRKGHKNAMSLVQNITGDTKAEVAKAVQTGTELGVTLTTPTADAPREVVDETPLWLQTLRTALNNGALSREQFRAIRSGLGEPPVERYPDLDQEWLIAAWAVAVDQLLKEAPSTPVEELRSASRTARDRLDPKGVLLRFEERLANRSFKMWIDESGQHHARMTFDDEAAAWVRTILQSANRPRRGPRFVGADAAEKTARAEADERSNEQLSYDTVVAVLRTGAGADPNQAFGDRQPGVRVLVEQGAITTDETGQTTVTGIGHTEDGGHALPGGVIEKFLCDAGATKVTLDSFGNPLDVGREHRLFTRKQRIAIAARDGGCLWPSCTAPISECEYHHIDHWWEDHGSTNVDDGVPLCRAHHMMLHNQRRKIKRERDPNSGANSYWLYPPSAPSQTNSNSATPRPGREPARLQRRTPRRFATLNDVTTRLRAGLA